MRVLLTRPAAESARIARQIRASISGLETSIWPLTRILPVADSVELPSGTEALLVTSAHAVRIFASLSPERDLPMCCVGPNTTGAARAAGFSDVHMGPGTASGLALMVRSAGWRRVHYLRAETVSTDLGAEISSAKIAVTETILYRAEAAGAPESDVSDMLHAGRIDLITVWSRGSAKHLAAFFAQSPDIPQAGCHLLAISEQAAEPLQHAGFTQIHRAFSPDGGGMIASIRALAIALRQ